ncbi:MAG: sel1 repeat family protein [Christensenellaceae bacterium]|nr:sel1 repeat family protein [Christensenellaceae bacterium]
MSGDKTALNNLGWCYKNGKGCTQDYAKAISLFEQSRTAAAFRHLGEIYELGLGVTQDKTEALRYYQVSAEKGNKFARQKVKELSE